ncbi:MAG: polysaccharide deacetylase family protein [Casimicrobiaceae bacterium]
MIDWTLRKVARLAAPGGRNGRLAILLYHRVLPTVDALNGWDVTAAEFEAQMAALRAHFSPLPMLEALDRLATRSLPPRAVCVTFDDGYADNAEVALPILQRLQMSATFFIATGYVDGGRMWNDTVGEAVRAWRAPAPDLGWGPIAMDTAAQKRAAIALILPRWKYLPAAEREARAKSLAHAAGLAPASSLMLTSTQVRTLRAAGMEIGAHTVTHPILARLDDADATREIVDSGRYLSDLLREPVPLFAYPNGRPGADYGPRDVAAVCAAGYRAAVSTAWGVAGSAVDTYQFPRFTPWDRAPRRFSLRLMANFRNVTPQQVATAAAAAAPGAV